MYAVSKDLINVLDNKFKKKYGESFDSNEILDEFFRELIHKCIDDSGCAIRNFGKFVMYQTRSGKTGEDVIRFKFMPRGSLLTKLCRDKYIMDKVPVKAKLEFKVQDKERIKDKTEISKVNLRTSKILAGQHCNVKTKDKITRDALLEMMINKDNIEDNVKLTELKH